MLRQAGHSWAREEHQHGAGCGHQQAERPAVQRAAVQDVLRTSGKPMDEATRTEMETRLRADFSDVRIHNDSAAKASATEIGARAYTSGNHVVVGSGGADKHTLAHELTHVIQQRKGPVAGTDNGSGLKVSDPSDTFERAAEANATAVMRAPLARQDRTAAAGQTGHGAARAEFFVQRAEEENTVPFFDAYGEIYTTSDAKQEVTTEDGFSLTVNQGDLEYYDETGSSYALWYQGSVVKKADVLCTPDGKLVHRTTGGRIPKTTPDAYERRTETTAALLEQIGSPRIVSVAGVHYKSVLRSRQAGWGEGAGRNFSIGDSRAEDGWRGMYLATTQAHARGYLNPGGVLLEIATPNMRAYDLTGIDYAALGFASPLASARLVKAHLGLDPNQDLMAALASRNMVLRSGEPGGEVEVIVPYGIANAHCRVTAELEHRD
ncbi:DUF4157 domain-containing protein [Streptomyces sp. Edi4]|uniref:eCIS core domain-containing protein n=1 Tax=Streptomyces sp. Edi4 TaxID=3162527 RepID=UPI0033067E60